MLLSISPLVGVKRPNRGTGGNKNLTEVANLPYPIHNKTFLVVIGLYSYRLLKVFVQDMLFSPSSLQHF